MAKDKETYEQLSERIDHLESEMKEIKELLREERKSASDTSNQKEYTESDKYAHGKRKWLSSKESSSPLTEEKATFTKEKPKDWEAIIGQVWLPRIFIIVLLIGVLWAFQSAVQNNWITEPVRLLLGYGSSVLLLFFGEKQLSSNRRGLGITLIGGAAGIWIFATFSGAVLYDLFPPFIAFLLYILCIGTGIVLSEIHKSQVLAVYLGIAGFLVPFLVGGEEGNFTVFFGYETFLTLCLGIYAWKKRHIIVLYVAMLLPPVVFFVYTIITALSESTRAGAGIFSGENLFAVFIIIIHILLMIGMYREKSSSRAKGTLLSFSFGAALLWSGITLLTPSIVYEIGWVNLNLSVFTSILVAGAAINGGLANKRKREKGMLFHLCTLFSVVASTIFLIILFDYQGYTLLFIIESYLLLWLGMKIHSKFQIVSGSHILFISGFAALYHIIEMEWGFTTALGEGVMFIIIAILFYKTIRADEEMVSPENKKIALFSLGIIIVGFTLVLLTRVVHLGAFEYFFTYRDVVVSVSWLVFAIGVLLAGIQWQKKPLRVFAVVWIFVTLAKAFLVDISYLDPIIRGILFILIGAVGVLVSRLFYTENRNS